MVYSSQNVAFRRDKYQFFAEMTPKRATLSHLSAIERRVQAIDYSFLLKHQPTLETEFNDLFKLLQKQETENTEQFWFYCYYCASLLEEFHRAYDQNEKAEYYSSVKAQIKNRFIKLGASDNKEEQGFIRSLYESFLSSIRSILKMPLHLAELRDGVVYANMCRLYWAFCKLTLIQGLTAASELHVIEKIDAILGTHTDVNKIISTLQAPTGVINYFSVGFFLARFMIDGGLLIKHTFFPTAMEKSREHGCEVSRLSRLPGVASVEAYRTNYILIENETEAGALFYIPSQGKAFKLKMTQGNLASLKQLLGKKNHLRMTAQQVNEVITKFCGHAPETTSRLQRFKHELYKRHCNFANDLVWATVNFLSNFNQVVHISNPVAGYLTAVFLIFDLGLTLYKCNLAKKEVLYKKSQYLEELAQYHDLNQCSGMPTEQRLTHIAFLNKQLVELELNWKAKEASFYFAAAAAAILMLGFTVAILVSAPLLMAVSFFVCTIAIAMYFSVGGFAKLKEKSLRLEQAELTGEHLAFSLKEYKSARNNFIFTMTKNTIVPLLLITTYAIYWPAALALTAVYLGYELFHAYQQHNDAKSVKQLTYEKPKEEPPIEFEELPSLGYS